MFIIHTYMYTVLRKMIHYQNLLKPGKQKYYTVV